MVGDVKLDRLPCRFSASARGFLSPPPLSARSRRKRGNLDPPEADVDEEERRCVVVVIVGSGGGGVFGSSSDAVESEDQDPLEPMESRENRFSGCPLCSKGLSAVVVVGDDVDVGSLESESRSLILGFRPP